MSSEPIRIDDPDDPRIAAYRDIRERDLVGRQGRFVAEGSVVLGALLSSSRFGVESLLLLENRIAGLGHLLQRVPPGVPIHVAGAAVLDAIAGFPMHRGVLAIGLRGRPSTAAELLAALPEEAAVIVLAGIANHDNIGAIFRNAAAFGADAVLIDRGCCDPLYRKAIRVSVGAVLRVPFAVCESTDDVVALLSERGFELFALSPRGARDVTDVAPGRRRAILLGSEGEGLPPALLDRLETVRIPMAPGFDSLNVAAASAIALHRLFPMRS